MCQILEVKGRKLKRAVTGYKILAEGRLSETSPIDRPRLVGYRTYGKRLEYPDGATVVSPSGPGIMVFTKHPKGRFTSWTHIKVRIPKGALVRKAQLYEGGDKVLCAERVIVIGEIPHG